MEWLQKAGDLLDKLDRTGIFPSSPTRTIIQTCSAMNEIVFYVRSDGFVAAETLEAVSNDTAADADELKILMVGSDMAIPLPCMRRLNTGG